MFQSLRTATWLLLTLTVVTGGFYPLAVTLIAQLAFPTGANGSLLVRGQQIVGSRLIGQSFSQPEYFWGRLSATSPMAYNASASSGSNYGPLHPALRAAAEKRIAALTAQGVDQARIPVDLVTASASGLDPHISPAAAAIQIPRIARARGMQEDVLRLFVQRHTEHRQFGILGEPRVNVLELNLALDETSRE